ncbi:hypothetical protein Nepgr_028989 [Nepenthes gracilis]|uniref:Uncharacterized protein n=1 Tax=Nepenthes gracilis TaxID=150966 RepID=A0AAD3TDE5_NEPGR|nr:hypothetical protein Nepgr_028989 [Nepenthes gracilis]
MGKQCCGNNSPPQSAGVQKFLCDWAIGRWNVSGSSFNSSIFATLPMKANHTARSFSYAPRRLTGGMFSVPASIHPAASESQSHGF